jgi:hypothetical protein
MRRIEGIADVFKLCSPDSVLTLKSKHEMFTTTASQTAVVLDQMGCLFFVGCIAPDTTSIERMMPISHVRMRSVPFLIAERIRYLRGTEGFSTPEAKNVLYIALASTPELSMLNELESHERESRPDKMPWGITEDTQAQIRLVYNEVFGIANASTTGVGKRSATGQPDQSDISENRSNGNNDVGDLRKRQRHG